MKTHEFRLVVKSDSNRKFTLFHILSLFARRNPDGCEFHLKNRKPASANAGASQERAAIKRKIDQMCKTYARDTGSKWVVLDELRCWVGQRTKRTAARKGALGRK